MDRSATARPVRHRPHTGAGGCLRSVRLLYFAAVLHRAQRFSGCRVCRRLSEQPLPVDHLPPHAEPFSVVRVSAVFTTLFNMAIIRELTRADLIARRDEVLRSVDLSSAELEEKAESGGLVGEEWSAWEEIQEIEYLLSDA